jgi:hypothetical protein
MKRGDVFTAVNGTQLTVSNYQSLLFGANETHFKFSWLQQDDFVVIGGKTVEFSKTELKIQF